MVHIKKFHRNNGLIDYFSYLCAPKCVNQEDYSYETDIVNNCLYDAAAASCGT